MTVETITLTIAAPAAAMSIVFLIRFAAEKRRLRNEKAILLALEGGPLSSYGIYLMFPKWGLGSMWETLYRMEAAGLISSEWDSQPPPPRSGGYRRRIYALTYAGRIALAELTP